MTTYAEMREKERSMIAVLRVNGRYYRGARFWRWTYFRRFAAELPIYFWEDMVIPKFPGKLREIITTKDQRNDQ